MNVVVCRKRKICPIDYSSRFRKPRATIRKPIPAIPALFDVLTPVVRGALETLQDRERHTLFSDPACQSRPLAQDRFMRYLDLVVAFN